MPVCLFIKCYALFNKGLQEGVKSEKRISIQGCLFKSREYPSTDKEVGETHIKFKKIWSFVSYINLLILSDSKGKFS